MGDGNQWHFAESGIKGLEICQILPAMKRSQSPSGQRAEKGEVEEIDGKMKNVELLRELAHLINHQREMRNDIAHGRIEAQRARTTGSQLSGGDRVRARKERHIVAKPDEFFGQVGNDPLSAAIETRRNALNERSDLCDFHNDLYFPPTITTRAAQLGCSSTRLASTTPSPWRGNKNAPVAWAAAGSGARLDVTPDQDAAIFCRSKPDRVCSLLTTPSEAASIFLGMWRF